MADILNNTTETPATTEEQGKGKPKKEKKAKEPKKQFLESNNMNFYERYETIVEGKQSDIDLSAYKLPIIIVAAILIAAFIIPEGLLIFTNIKNKSLEKFIADSANNTSYNEALQVKGAIDETLLQKTNLEALIVAIDSYPNVDSNFFTAIANAATSTGVTITNYSYVGGTGLLSLACTATTIQGVSDFYRALSATGLLSNVDYVGFTASGEETYIFSISGTCVAATK